MRCTSSTAHMLFTALSLALLAQGCLATQPPPAFGPDLRSSSPSSPVDAAWSNWFRGDTAGAEAALLPLLDDEQVNINALFGAAELAIHQVQISRGLKHHRDLILAHPTHPLSRWSAARLWELREYTPDWAEAVVALAENLRGKNADLETRALLSLAFTRARFELHQRDPDALLWDGGRDGFSQHWRLAGPFSIFPLLDEDTAFTDVEADSQLRDSYTVDDVTRKTRTLLLDQPEVNHTFSVTGVYYLETWVTVPQELDAIVQFHSGSSHKIWINDTLLHTRDVAKGYPPSLFGAQVKLSAGQHRIRVRAAIQNDREPFLLLLNPVDGAATPKDFRFTATPVTDVKKPGQVTVSGADIFSELSGDTVNGHPFLLWLKATWQNNVGDYHGARQTLDALLALTPEFAPGHFLLGNAFRNDPAISPALQDEQAIQRYRKALDVDPLSNFTADRLAFLLYTQEQYREALGILDRLATKVQDEYIIQYHRHLIFKERDWIPQAREALKRALDANPTNCTLIATQWNTWIELSTLPDQDKLPANFLGCDITQEHLANHYNIPRGELGEAIARFKTLAARNPSISDYLSSLAYLYELNGQPDEAAQALQTSRERLTDPTIVDLQHFDAILARDGKEGARAFLDSRLNLNRGNYYLLRQRARLDGEQVLGDLRVDGDALVKAHLKAPTGEDSSAVYLLDYAATRVFPDGSHLTLTHILLRVHNKEGIDAFGEVSLPGDALILSVRSIKPDGRKLEPEPIFGKPSLSIPNLEPGDFIEYEYLSAGDGSQIREGTFLGFRFFFHITDAPMLRSEFVLEVPEGWNPRFDRRQDAPEPVVKTQPDGSRRYTFTARDTPRVMLEPGTTPTAETLPSIQPFHNYTWRDLHATYRDRLLANLRLSEAIREKTAQVIRGAGSQLEATRTIFKFALDTINDDTSGPFSQPAAHVLSAGAGDRLVLIAAMLTAAGVPNEIVLARTMSSDMTNSDLPNIDPWGFPLLRVRPDGDTIWLDPGVDYALFNHIPPTLQGARGFTLGHVEPELNSDDAFFVEIPEFPVDNELREIELSITVSPTGDASGEVTERYRGEGAIFIRQVLDQYTDPEEFKQALAQALADSFPGFALTSLKIDNHKTTQHPLSLQYKFTSSGFAVREGDALSLSRTLFPASLEASLAGLPERKTPLALEETVRMTMRSDITFPEGFKVVMDTQPLALETLRGHFTRDIILDQNRVSITRALTLRAQRISPEQYAAFKRFAREADAGEVLRIHAKPE